MESIFPCGISSSSSSDDCYQLNSQGESEPFGNFQAESCKFAEKTRMLYRGSLASVRNWHMFGRRRRTLN